jgi:hypothetical protein
LVLLLLRSVDYKPDQLDGNAQVLKDCSDGNCATSFRNQFNSFETSKQGRICLEFWCGRWEVTGCMERSRKRQDG